MCQELPAPAPALLTLLWAGRQQSHDHALPFTAAQLLMGYSSSIPPPAPPAGPFFVASCPPAPRGRVCLPIHPQPRRRASASSAGHWGGVARLGISCSRRTAIWLQKEGIRKASASSPAADTSGCLWPTPSLPQSSLRRGEVIKPAGPGEGAGGRHGLRARTFKSASQGSLAACLAPPRPLLCPQHIVPAPRSPPRSGCTPGAGRGTRGCQALPGAQPHAVPACWRSARVSAARAASNHGNGFSSRPGVGFMVGERSSSRCGQHAWGVCECPRGPCQPRVRAV